jgi:hypothetical protein
MTRSAEQTTRWVAGNISKMHEVKEAEVISPHTIQITRKKYEPFVAAIISVPIVTPEILQPLLSADSKIEIVANVPKESLWTGNAIEAIASQSVAFGGISDLMSAVSRKNIREYIRREYEFVERGLKQHHRVSELKREFDRVYVVLRPGFPPLRFVMLNEYELTADHVRTAKSQYGIFDTVLLNDPNGKPTSSALQVAENMGIEILKWREFLGRLNRP